jgi:hypothetical protein
MIRIHTLAGLGLCVALAGQVVQAQDLTQYRGYALAESLDAVLATSKSRASDAKVRFERPARIQELEWRAPYVRSGTEMADPVETLTFMFYNDVLYQITARYDRSRVEGLTASDIITTLSGTYGTPVPSAAAAKSAVRRPVDVPTDMVLLAAWESDSSSVLLLRGSYSSDLQLMIISKALALRAKAAIKEGVRLDAIEAPQRDADRRKQEIVDDNAARSKARETNKAAFRP